METRSYHIVRKQTIVYSIPLLLACVFCLMLCGSVLALGSDVDTAAGSSPLLSTRAFIPTNEGYNDNNVLRRLEQNSRDSGDSGDENRYYNNEYNNDENGDNDDDGNLFSRFGDRVMSDMSTMWDTAPSEWVVEYWEVFAGLAIFAFFLLTLHCCMAYDICCGHSDNKLREPLAGGRPAMTALQRQQKLLEKETAIDPQSSRDGKTSSPEPILSSSSKYQPPTAAGPNSLAPREDSEMDGIIKDETASPTPQSAENSSSGTPTSSSMKWKHVQRLVQETTTVWMEFLGFSSPYESEYERQTVLRRRKKRRPGTHSSARSSLTDDGASTTSTYMSSVFRDGTGEKIKPNNNQEQIDGNYVDADDVEKQDVPSPRRAQLV
mmetsp:Transcript_6063/g.11886  ORF Transcript_6063/g.11886 Transcript_6063/m.11886 type:complete len:378 (-) Transcript_6063:317-1450(-)